ncbi:hypothetical protein HHK36_004883 [Tetracentron sinense]|uniref:Uncharacterized protein n=1 Tax=Tetracentron sinense TaxID=13715 RepID=A0A835DQ96_TETSI|nr:hypothetical protein HHK36_004883 [Tetracentron sinense]
MLIKGRVPGDACPADLDRAVLIGTFFSLYMPHAVVGGVYMIRFAVGATLTEERHVNVAWKVVQEHAGAILGASN